jgi:hypothetical protein
MGRIFYLFHLFVFVMLMFPFWVLAQETPTGDEVSFGKYALPVILYAVLGLVYKILPAIPNRGKILISVIFGVGISLLAIEYAGKEWTIVNIVDHTLYGLFAGTAAGGLYEGINRAAFKPRE